MGTTDRSRSSETNERAPSKLGIRLYNFRDMVALPVLGHIYIDRQRRADRVTPPDCLALSCPAAGIPRWEEPSDDGI